MKSLKFLILFVLLAQFVLGTEIENYSVDYTLISDKTSVKTVIEFQEPITNLELILPRDSKAIEVKDIDKFFENL